MYRAIPVINKAIDDRARARRDQLHHEKIRNMRSQVDTTKPSTVHLDHIRTNYKKEQMLEERYHQIDRENQLLLQRMSDSMKSLSKGPPQRSASGPVSMSKTKQKQELQRITRENNGTLQRIQSSKPVLKVTAWQEDYRRSQTYVKNICEYPVVLNQGKKPKGGVGARSASLTMLGGTQRTQASSPSGGEAAEEAGKEEADDALQYVLKTGKKIGATYYLLEMATDGRTLTIAAYDGEAKKQLELVVNERNHRQMYREAYGEYAKISELLRVSEDGERLYLDSPHPMDPSSPAAA